MSEHVFAVDTTFGACSVALLLGDHVLARRFVVMPRGHAEALAPMAEAVMAEAGLGFGTIDKLAVTVGPGSFTGQRVGLAFVRGLGVALKRPMVGITSLAAMAAEAQAESGLAIAAAVHDAKRGEVYLETTIDHRAQVIGVAAAQALLGSIPALALAGTGAGLMASPNACVLPIVAPDAVWVARLAVAAVGSDAPPRPLYLRAPDAKLPAAR